MNDRYGAASPYAPPPLRRRGSFLSATLWMGLLSLLLFWLPLVGPFIAGFVGGHKAGRVGTALLAAAMPAILLALLVVLVAALFGLPLVGVLAGAALFVFVVVHSVPLFLGALAGAVIWPA